MRVQGHLRELYAVEVSPDLISRVTDAVLEEVRDWQNRPLDTVYPVVFFDALRVKIRDESVALEQGRSTLALALDCEGQPTIYRACGLSRPRARSSGCGSRNELKKTGKRR